MRFLRLSEAPPTGYHRPARDTHQEVWRILRVMLGLEIFSPKAANKLLSQEEITKHSQRGKIEEGKAELSEFQNNTHPSDGKS